MDIKHFKEITVFANAQNVNSDSKVEILVDECIYWDSETGLKTSYVVEMWGYQELCFALK